uniref:Uncharacterized protein n=1 Tax=Alexandrium catenella TaxID=2925 RepID=A0A7S1WMY2_ALECA|mmetsp:Transcript_7549/g.20440  ORF Transcript_7549/g.20440 Transcript_7549/m.20440 type:complete len:222 (+) Transcript_7549:53-718(+)
MGKDDKAGKSGGPSAPSAPAGGRAEGAAAGACFRGAPVRTNAVHACHFGPGSQWGKPYYRLGQECEKSLGSTRSPMALDSTLLQQTRTNDRIKEKTLCVFADLPSHRSHNVSFNKDGLAMDSQSHYTKIGSKHACEVRPDHSFAAYRSASLPHLHPYNSRRAQFKDPTPWHLNAAFSTTNDAIGLFYSSNRVSEPLLRKRATANWIPPSTPASTRSGSQRR